MEPDRKSQAIPPDPVAVQAALRRGPGTPAKGMRPLVVGLFLVGALGYCLGPSPASPDEPPSAVEEPEEPTAVLGRPVVHRFGLIVDLAPNHRGVRTQLEGALAFRYRSSLSQADLELRLPEGKEALLAELQQVNRGQFFRQRDRILAGLRTTLERQLFPDGEGQVMELDWEGELHLR